MILEPRDLWVAWARGLGTPGRNLTSTSPGTYSGFFSCENTEIGEERKSKNRRIGRHLFDIGKESKTMAIFLTVKARLIKRNCFFGHLRSADRPKDEARLGGSWVFSETKKYMAPGDKKVFPGLLKA